MKLLDIVEAHDTWNVIDSSKLSTYMQCPRKFYFRYVLGWEKEIPNHHLSFGTAWHLAVEHLLRNNYTKESLEEAQYLFYARYKQDIEAYDIKELSPKDPENALLSLKNYFVEFFSDVRNYEVLKTEIAGLVMISPTATMHFKLDALLKERKSGKVLFIDQKTSQRKYTDWGNHWQLSTQMLTYLHALHCLFPREEIGRSKIRCSFFYKKSNTDFEESEIVKSPSQLQSWLVRTNVWYQNLQYDMQLLEEEDDTENTAMLSFPQNDNACFSYGTQCAYFNFCNAWSNPLERSDEVPIGFVKKFWDPREDETIRERINLTAESE